MFVVVGLGNPGRKYRANRHNVGFMVADIIAKRHEAKFRRWKGVARVCRLELNGEAVLLAKPTTFMNLSGIAVARITDYYGVSPQNVIVVHDDLDLPPGTLRLKRSGSSGGHKGVQSIIDAIGPDFLRVRVGIGKPQDKEQTVEYVLSDFTPEQREVMQPALERAADATEALIKFGFERAAGVYNRKDANAKGVEP